MCIFFIKTSTRIDAYLLSLVGIRSLKGIEKVPSVKLKQYHFVQLRNSPIHRYSFTYHVGSFSLLSWSLMKTRLWRLVGGVAIYRGLIGPKTDSPICGFKGHGIRFRRSKICRSTGRWQGRIQDFRRRGRQPSSGGANI